MMIGPGRLLSKEHTTLHKMGAAAAEIKEFDDEADCLFDSLRLKEHGMRAGPGRAHWHWQHPPAAVLHRAGFLNGQAWSPLRTDVSNVTQPS